MTRPMPVPFDRPDSIRQLADAVQLGDRGSRLRERLSGTRCRPTCRRWAARVRTMLRAELLDDLRAGGDDVADCPAADAAPRTVRSGRAGSPCGNVGNARSSTIPVISQWPVTESLPGERLRHAPERRTSGCAHRRDRPGKRAQSRPSPRDRQRAAACSGDLPARCFRACRCPRRRTGAASGRAPMPAPSSTSTIARVERRMGHTGGAVRVSPARTGSSLPIAGS